MTFVHCYEYVGTKLEMQQGLVFRKYS